MDTTLFYFLLFIHLSSLVLGFGSVLVIDTFGLFWTLKTKGFNLERVKSVAQITQRLIWVGYAGLIASGIPMLVLKGYVDNLTKIKIFFVVMVGANGVFLHYIKKALDKLGESENVPTLHKFRIGLASAISQIGWWGAMFIGFYHRHISHDVAWPQNHWPFIFTVIFIIGLSALVIELGFARALKRKAQSLHNS